MSKSEPEYLVYDIETIPESEIAADWTDREYKSGERKGEQKFPPIWAHKVVSIATLRLDREGLVLDSEVCAGGAVTGDERGMIARWSALACSGSPEIPLTLVDYNGRTFDIPVLQCRSFHYGFSLKWLFDKLPDSRGSVSQWSKAYRDRYGGKHFDLLDYFTNRGAFNIPLDKLAKMMGLPGKGEMSGGQVYDAWKEGRKAEIDKYCLEDVFQTTLLFLRMRLTAGWSPRSYRAAIDRALEHIGEQPGYSYFLDQLDTDAVRGTRTGGAAA